MTAALQERLLERQLLDAIGEAVVATDEDERIVYGNRAAAALYGTTVEDMLGRPIREVVAPSMGRADQGEIRRCVLAGRTWSGVVTGHRADGSTFPHRVTLSPLLDDDGTLRGMVGVGQDITEELAAAERVRAADQKWYATVHGQKERLDAILAAAGVATWDLDFATMRQTVSDNYADLLGLPFDEVPETFDEILALVHPDDRALFADPTPEADASGDRFDVEFRMVRADGQTIWLGCQGSFVRDADDVPVGLRGTMVNLTEQRSVEIRRVEAENRYRQTIEAANDAFIAVDAAGTVCEWNAAAERLFGWPEEEVRGRPVVDTLVPEDRRERYLQGWASWADALADGRGLPERWEMTALRRDGSTFPVELSLVAGTDAGGAQVRAFVRDISERREHEHRLAELAVTDALTGLPDRTVLVERLSGGLAELQEAPGALAVLFVDLDGFKGVNDLHGHDAGDLLLVSVAQRLRSAVRPDDTVTRVGGDEFAVVCEGLVGVEDARQVAERILAALEVPVPLGTEQIAVGASVGIAVVTDGAVDPASLLHDADQAMYRAKRRGGHGYAL